MVTVKRQSKTRSGNQASNRALWRRQLAQGMGVMGLDVDDLQQDMLLDYLELLLKWNAIYNLTAIREPKEIVSRQLLDSLSILPLISVPRVLDVGTVAGFPGVV